MESIGARIRVYVPSDLRETYVKGVKTQMTTTVWSESFDPVVVNVAKPGTLAASISEYVSDLETVNWLQMTGTPDENDCRLFRRMLYLEKLDLSGVTGLKNFTGCDHLEYLREVKLPDGLEKIGENAFEECKSLTSVYLPEGITVIDGRAFYNTESLERIEFPETLKKIYVNAFNRSGIREVDFKNVEYLGEYSFNDCPSLKEVDFKEVNFIGDWAFHSTPIEKTNFNKVEIIGYASFRDTPLKEVEWGSNLKEIRGSAFSGCRSLEKIILPEGFQRIGGSSFYGCENVIEIRIPSTLEPIYTMDGPSFSFMPKLGKVTMKSIFPSNIGEAFQDINENCILYVPLLSLNEYMVSDSYRHFKNIKPLEEDLTDIEITGEYKITSDKGIADKANISVGSTGGSGALTISRIAPLALNNFSQLGQYSTFIAESQVSADNLLIKMGLSSNQWSFLTFPFDINVKDIEVDKDALWVVRRYNGENRAAMDENKPTWENVNDDEVLKAGEGYIFHCADYTNFTFRPANDGNGYFAKDDVVKSLNEYPSEFPHNASWNLVGNTFPAYLNIKAIDFDGPVTVYTNSNDWYGQGNYETFSPLDDEYVFSAFQAFFVQKQDVETGARLTLKPEGRAHSYDACRKLYETEENLTRASSERALFNLHITGENGTDRTRLVVNEEASVDYEPNRDASKFPAVDPVLPQIFMLNNGIRMAIDEQPLGEGLFAVGTALQKGHYTISLSTRRADNFEAFLMDSKTGAETNLSESGYSFVADGNDDSRFTLSIRRRPIQSGVEQTVDESGIAINVSGNLLTVKSPTAVSIVVATVDGKVVMEEKTDSFSTELPKGLYIVKANQKIMKVVVR
ncbi:MAG: leucine-rich repeat domain-containing protein, partial [Muribaculaceae bacterium]|nr:leucine-rich repeat domain-containing protein [Muribaculaceae bacterium]